MEMWLKVGLPLAALLFCFSGFYVYRLRGEARIVAAERAVRNRVAGVIVGVIALAMCVPQAAAISWDWLADILWWLVVVLAVSSYIFLDHLLSRAIGGLLVMSAYYLVNYGFAIHLPLGAAGYALALLWGAFGLCISGWPYLLRDILRGCGRKDRWRIFFSVVLWFSGVWWLLTFILLMVR